MLNTIKHGDTGNIVKAAQLLTGYADRKKASSQFDAGFVAHIVAWQGNHKLTSDGEIGAATWTAIASNAPTCSTSKNKTSSATHALQLLLDGASLKADGVFGSKTKAAVVAFQAASGLDADGICGPKTWSALIVGRSEASGGEAAGTSTISTHTPGTFKQPVDYKQADSRWGKKIYSNHNSSSQTMANSACGPTAMADILATWFGISITPWTLAQLAMQWGDRTTSSGTAWSFFGHIQSHYKIKKMVSTTSLATLKACIDAGGYVVCSMGPGYWTKGGHYICAWMYDSKNIYCNDPASSKRTKQKSTEFMKERKHFWCFYPELEAA